MEQTLPEEVAAIPPKHLFAANVVWKTSSHIGPAAPAYCPNTFFARRYKIWSHKAAASTSRRNACRHKSGRN